MDLIGFAISITQLTIGLSVALFYLFNASGRAETSSVRRTAFIVSGLGILAGMIDLLRWTSVLSMDGPSTVALRIITWAFWVAFVWYFYSARRSVKVPGTG